MCAINPKRQMHFTLSVYTSIEMTEARFASLVAEAALTAEIQLNGEAGTLLRWHINEIGELPNE